MTPLTAYDELVNGLVAKGVPRDRAEKRARELQPLRVMLEDPRLEDDIVRAGDDLMASLGFEVVRNSQKRRSKVTPGVPDRRYYHRARKLFCWWEAKASWGVQSPAQRNFQELCDACGDPYVLGGLEALKSWLAGSGVATFDEHGLPQPILPSQEH